MACDVSVEEETEAVLERKLAMKDSFILEMKKGQEKNKQAMQKLEEKLFDAIQEEVVSW